MLGLPTAQNNIWITSEKDKKLDRIYYVFTFKEQPHAKDVLRKPTVFSGAIHETYGTYWGANAKKTTASIDGFGRTITLCVGDLDDGEIGVREAVVSAGTISGGKGVYVGYVPQDLVPTSPQIDVKLFAQKRHGKVLGMTL